MNVLLNTSDIFCRWSKIAAHFPGRTDNEIKNQWNTKIKKKLKLLGIDPKTHKPVEKEKDFASEEARQQPAETSREELKFQDNNPGFMGNNQIENNQVDQCCSPGQESNLVQKSETMITDIDAAQSESFSSTSMQEGSHQHWIDNLEDYLLSWDWFSNLEEIFPLDTHQ